MPRHHTLPVGFRGSRHSDSWTVGFCSNERDRLHHDVGATEEVGTVCQRPEQPPNRKPLWRNQAGHRRCRSSNSYSPGCQPVSSTGVQLFSAFFTTPREALRVLEQYVPLQQPQQRRKRTIRGQRPVFAGTTKQLKCDDPRVWRTSEDTEAQRSEEELVQLLNTARLLCSSLRQTTAAVTSVRAGVHVLVRQSRSLTLWISPLSFLGATREF
ncbi:hypothetical protein, conserved [Trypanosoma brucei gambiense DAL972]|uniref:Uncharacterized protein n=2 Tax=Trypanosoma brucei TaxID=5691 RepID=D0A8R0_TRYB9|nr:hypothetical protein, conserved [Trypanosoma brucei gambiense DAL972]RHW67836.1 hypothetical protein DPX39_110080400 [Trypanosoma brucei equiperdum]CBH18061.1 hypothetical protein, conserved [Trypanosoma brucei gambiense DAL972]|eukprot:XP_011780325.1 hypothetical protein, conserved [Trypanosoma brucei gambiense DAL972]